MGTKNKWTIEEDQFLIKNYEEMGPKKLMTVTGRSHASLSNRARKFKLKHFSKYNVQLGEKYNRLLVVGKNTIKDNDGKYRFICRCNCGNTIEIAGKFLATGHTKSCGCLNKDILIERHLPKGTSSFNYLYQTCKSNAKRRKLDFELTYEQHTNIIQQDCYHCDRKPEKFNRYGDNSKVSQITKDNSIVYKNGIDRLDNNKDYIFENCVSCCQSCNEAKKSLTLEQFQADNERRYLHQQKRKNGHI